jgi:hypothetical protein
MVGSVSGGALLVPRCIPFDPEGDFTNTHRPVSSLLYLSVVNHGEHGSDIIVFKYSKTPGAQSSAREPPTFLRSPISGRDGILGQHTSKITTPGA